MHRKRRWRAGSSPESPTARTAPARPASHVRVPLRAATRSGNQTESPGIGVWRRRISLADGPERRSARPWRTRCPAERKRWRGQPGTASQATIRGPNFGSVPPSVPPAELGWPFRLCADSYRRQNHPNHRTTRVLIIESGIRVNHTGIRPMARRISARITESARRLARIYQEESAASPRVGRGRLEVRPNGAVPRARVPVTSHTPAPSRQPATRRRSSAHHSRSWMRAHTRRQKRSREEESTDDSRGVELDAAFRQAG